LNLNGKTGNSYLGNTYALPPSVKNKREVCIDTTAKVHFDLVDVEVYSVTEK